MLKLLLGVNTGSFHNHIYIYILLAPKFFILLILYLGVNSKYLKIKTQKLKIRINKINHIIGDYFIKQYEIRFSYLHGALHDRDGHDSILYSHSLSVHKSGMGCNNKNYSLWVIQYIFYQL